MMKFLSKFIPLEEENKLNHVGDTEFARKTFFESRHRNLDFLLRKRFLWMNDFIKETDSNIYELGSGAGLLREYIKHPMLKLTDVEKRSWIDLHVDALNLPFENNSIDVFICSHMLHHLVSPIKVLKLIESKLKVGGRLIISDINTSLALKLILIYLRHEGWDETVDVFDEHTICNLPDDPWSANCSVPKMIFENKKKFKGAFEDFKFLKFEYTECFILPLSGGVISKSRMPQLPFFLLHFVDLLDRMLIFFAPSIFSMGFNIVLEKTKDHK